MKFLNEVKYCNRIDMIGDCLKGVIHGVLSSDPLDHCLVHSSLQKETLPAMEIGDPCYSMDEGHVDCVLALESLPCEKNSGGQMDEIKPVPILEENKEGGKPSSSSQDGPILKQFPENLRYAFLGKNLGF